MQPSAGLCEVRAHSFIKEEFFFCRPLITNTKAQDFIIVMKDFFKAQDFADWSKNIGSICTDGAPAMLGNKSGVAALVKVEAPHAIVTHCILHRHALAVKTLPKSLNDVMSTAIQVVNFIRARATNHRLFKVLYQDIGFPHNVLLYYTEVRWLSRGQAFSRLIELHTEVAMFLQEKRNALCEEFNSPEFILVLAYLAKIFSHVNDLNISIQGSNKTIVDAGEKLKSFLEKLPLWMKRVQNNNVANVARLEEILSYQRIERDVPTALKDDILIYLRTLQTSFDNYFGSEVLQQNVWVRNPFTGNLDSVDDEDLVKDDLIDFRCKELLKSHIYTMDEVGFSTLVAIKIKSRNRLDAEDDMRVAPSKTSPQFYVLVNKKQQQRSQ
ncbi:Ribonuclease H-like domain [Trinorchestia longiramus]|nr:Ribonuclease H-like domain [Trinorchestia longiramus]